MPRGDMEVAIILVFICFIPFLGEGQNHRTDDPPFNLQVLLGSAIFFVFFCLSGGATLVREMTGL